MLKQVVGLVQDAQQEATDLDMLQRVEARRDSLGAENSMHHLAVGSELVRVRLHG